MGIHAAKIINNLNVATTQKLWLQVAFLDYTLPHKYYIFDQQSDLLPLLLLVINVKNDNIYITLDY